MQFKLTHTFWNLATAVAASFIVATSATHAGSKPDLKPQYKASSKQEQTLPWLRKSARKKFKAAATDFDNKNFEEALRKLALLKLNKRRDIAERHYLKAICYQALGQFSDSQNEFDWVTQHCPDSLLLEKVLLGRLQVAKQSTDILATQITGPFKIIFDPKALAWHGVPVPGYPAHAVPNSTFEPRFDMPKTEAK